MSCELSVIICTHDPRPEFLRRALDALRTQTLSKDRWELLLIDNASPKLLAEHWDLGWHPAARHIREEELGITPARLRGMREFSGGIIVFVDDDNVLAPDYLEEALKIGNAKKTLGAWGGCIDAAFEVKAPAWTQPFWSYLAIRKLDRSFCSKETSDYSPFPAGAGLCLRHDVAKTHVRNTEADPQMRELLGRKGRAGVQISCEDTAMVLTACDMGYEYGVFTELRLAHIIPQGRLTEEYLSRTVEGSAFGTAILRARRNGETPPAPYKPGWRLQLGAIRRRLMLKRPDRLMLEARMRGFEKAKMALSRIQSMAIATPAKATPPLPAK